MGNSCSQSSIPTAQYPYNGVSGPVDLQDLRESFPHDNGGTSLNPPLSLSRVHACPRAHKHTTTRREGSGLGDINRQGTYSTCSLARNTNDDHGLFGRDGPKELHPTGRTQHVAGRGGRAPYAIDVSLTSELALQPDSHSSNPCLTGPSSNSSIVPVGSSHGGRARSLANNARCVARSRLDALQKTLQQEQPTLHTTYNTYSTYSTCTCLHCYSTTFLPWLV
jgi:hypothetical protein